MARMHVMQRSDTQKVMDRIHQALGDRLAVSSLEPCPVEFTSSFIDMCATQSCGKCTPCRVGLAQLKRLIDSVLDEQADERTLQLIERTALSISLSADCAIGYEAAAMALEAIRGFRKDFEYHIEHGCCGFQQSTRVPCVSGCPAGVDIPGYIALVGAGRNTDAVKLIRKDNPLPIACGLICEHPCEINCRRGMVDNPMNIRGIKRYATDHMESDYRPEVAPATGKKVAVIGGGPAGLTAAYYLALMGHAPTIYEQRAQLGGMLRYGIPSYRLPREELQREIDWLVDTGIEVKTDVSVGHDVSIQSLVDGYDAVYVAIGAHSDRKLGIPGENAEGVTSAVDMLRKIGDDIMPDFTGKHVVVVGGGNVAMDVARSSVRLGASAVDIVYRRRKVDMTAQDDEIAGAIAEGCNLMELNAPVEVVTKDGKVAGLKVQPQIIGEKKNGRFAPHNASCDPVVVDCDIVAVAIGQSIDSQAFEDFGMAVNRGRILASSDGSILEMPGVFAGGDCVSGPATVIRAVEAGKTAAANIDRYLGSNHVITTDVDIPPVQLTSKTYCARSNMTERPAAERKDDFNLMENCFTEEEVLQEASRCLRCDHFGLGAFRGGRIEQW